MVTLIAELGSRPAQRVLQALASWTGHVRREVVIDEKRREGHVSIKIQGFLPPLPHQHPPQPALQPFISPAHTWEAIARR